MNKTSYEKEGLNSLNELFEKLIVCSEKQDKEGTLRIVSSLNDEEKDYLYTWATEQGKLDKVAGIVIKAEMDKKAFDINCRFKKALCEALVQNGYCLEGDPDVYNSDSFPFTDNKYINGEVIFDTRKVQLKARDAENRKYEKTIDYSSVGDLMESINHFRKDIEETFEKPEVVEEVVKEEPFDILNDKNFLKEIGADWVTDLIKKKADDELNDEQEYFTYDQLSEKAKEKVRYWLNDIGHDWWYKEDLPEEQKSLLAEKYNQYGITLESLDVEWDNHGCTVNLASGFKYWPAFKNILVDCAKQVLKDLPKFKQNSDLLEDWATEAAGDMYFSGDHFEFYAGLSDIDNNNGYALSEKISDLCNDAYETKISPILSDISYDFDKIVRAQEDFFWSDEYARDMCEANDYEFDKDGNRI